MEGSSPLARGLPVPRLIPLELLGIIPARAGFTRPVRRGPKSGADHPRSRGVYVVGQEVHGVLEGSSPLARGLRQGRPPCRPQQGIIPARAGFTGTLSASPGTGWDHPRSRGVYLAQATAARRLGGSSPLARGLRLRQHDGPAAGRIIPARAGFTRSSPTCPSSVGDHPRSRGVYDAHTSRHHECQGSSPLARGLRSATPSTRRWHGIIPARAGFTLADPWNPNDGLPYQTAFTFTGDLAPAPPSCGSAVVSRRSTTTPSAA